MNLSTDFVRRAAEYTRSTVGATVSSVGDRMSKSRRSRDGSIDTHTLTHEDVLMNAKEKYNLSLKVRFVCPILFS